MRTTWIGRLIAVAAVAAGVVVATPVGAAAAKAAEPAYDPARTETVTGTVEAVVRTRAGGGRAAGVQLRVKTAAGTVPVHVGPAWWSDRQPFQFRRGDKVAVTGSRAATAQALVAGTITRGEDEAIALRDERGRAVWEGWRRR